MDTRRCNLSSLEDRRISGSIPNQLRPLSMFSLMIEEAQDMHKRLLPGP